MGALPKRRISSRRQGKRRHCLKLNLPKLTKCKHCGSAKLPHVMCPNCNKY